MLMDQAKAFVERRHEGNRAKLVVCLEGKGEQVGCQCQPSGDMR